MAETLVVGQSINYWLLDCKRKVEMQNPSLRLQADKHWGDQTKEIENQMVRMGIRKQRQVPSRTEVQNRGKRKATCSCSWQVKNIRCRSWFIAVNIEFKLCGFKILWIMRYLPSFSSFTQKTIANHKVFGFYSDVSARISTEILNVLLRDLVNALSPSLKISH